MTEIFAIQSDISEMPNVEERLFHFCREHNVGDCYSAVSVAALQAVENAIVHGNRGEAELKVTLTMGTCRGGIFVEVKDEGQGFDYSSYGSLPESSESAGEGIFIMSQLADAVKFYDGGSKVRLEFMVNGIDLSECLERIAVLKAYYSMVAA